ncbi:MAG: YgdI/YgdR family lipoprotein [Verrucomicrobia bacterium]|nr:YgdI/YgdR family lipoprotein [Verrucomicrobiota bacterium]
MKRLLHSSILLVLIAAGCAMHYDISTTDGNRYRTASKPKLNEMGFYVFKDGVGREHKVSRLRIRKIEAVNPGDPPAFDFN